MTPPTRVRNGGFTRMLLDSHSLIGVVFGAFVYLICISGALAVVADEFELWERPDAPAVTVTDVGVLAATTQHAVAAARAAGTAKYVYVALGTADLPRSTVRAMDGKGGEREWNADAAGRLVPRAAAPWSTFIRKHHASLNIPEPFGQWVVGLIGTALLASLFSGLLAHRRILKDAFRLRWGGSRRLANADLHNRIGVWALPFHFIVALTGSLLGLAGLIILVLAAVTFKGDGERAIAALTGPPVVADARPAPVPDFAAMGRTILSAEPGARIEGVSLESVATRGQRVRMSVAAPGHLTRAELWNFDGNGRSLGKLGLSDGPVGMRIYGMLSPLHYGTYGGILLKLVYLLLGLGMATMVATGPQILLARRREQGHASPRWERVWDGVVWGQPVAMVASALMAVTLTVPPLPVYWIVTLGIVAIAVARPLLRILRAAIGGGCILLGLMHVAARPSWDPVAIGVDVLLAMVGAAFLIVGRSAAVRTARGWRAARANAPAVANHGLSS